jgi:hypothetical protein
MKLNGENFRLRLRRFTGNSLQSVKAILNDIEDKEGDNVSLTFTNKKAPLLDGASFH